MVKNKMTALDIVRRFLISGWLKYSALPEHIKSQVSSRSSSDSNGRDSYADEFELVADWTVQMMDATTPEEHANVEQTFEAIFQKSPTFLVLLAANTNHELIEQELNRRDKGKAAND